MGDQRPNKFPESFISPPQREIKDPGNEVGRRLGRFLCQKVSEELVRIFVRVLSESSNQKGRHIRLKILKAEVSSRWRRKMVD